MEMKAKVWNNIVVWCTLFVLVCIGIIVIWIDPAFHYHGPSAKFEYFLTTSYQRYVNDGIIRHFDYDAIITGNSMIENFKVSEYKDIFGGVAIKVPFQSGWYKEIDENVEKALTENPKCKTVIRCLDYARLVADKDSEVQNYDYPTYLYDDNPFNDIEYLWNEDVLFRLLIDNTIIYTKNGGKTTDFDKYSNWNDLYEFGKEPVMASYVRPNKRESEENLTLNEQEMVRENIRQNVVDTAKRYPDVTFYIFFPPYSIAYYDILNQNNSISWRIEAERIAIEELLGCENIILYSFADDYDVICNLNNYKDYYHYGEDINSKILQDMYTGNHRITESNYEDYLANIKNFYTSYDYDSLYN